jgi:hypothetical protein
LHIKFLLDRLDQSTERGLLHAEPFRGARNVPFLGDRDEMPEVSQFHCHTQKSMNFAWIMS